MPNKKYSQKFRKEWLQVKEFSSWLREVPGDNTKAHCKFCRCDILAKHSLLQKHIDSKKHKSCIPFESAPLTNYFVSKCNESARVEAGFALNICCHSSINTCDHLVEFCKATIKDSSVLSKIKMHRTKCSSIIKNVLSEHFEEDLISDIGERKFSLLLDESNDVSVTKILGVAIIYFSIKHHKIIHTFLTLIALEKCDAVSIVTALKEELLRLKLNISKLIGIGTDNASVMTGVNNGVYKQLKADVPNLILIRCVCHSIQLAVSHASSEALLRSLDYLISETYSWFSHSATRQIAYKQIYQTINDSKVPLKIVNTLDTRWLSIEPAISRILNQWLELKTHFEVARLTDKCYKAEVLYNMCRDEKHLLYLLALHPVLVQVQKVNKVFESNDADKTKLLDDLTRLMRELARSIMLPTSRIDPLLSDIQSHLDPEPNLGFRFERKATELISDKKISKEDIKIIRERTKNFLFLLFQQLKQRLPDNVSVLKQITCFSVQNTLKHIKEPVSAILQVMLTTDDEIAAAELQYNNIHLNNWSNISKTEDFWVEVDSFRDSSGVNPYKEISECALNLLALPNSNAEIERVFSMMNIIKSKLRNRMQLPMLNAILKVKYGVRRHGKCCKNYDLPASVINKIGTMATYRNTSTQESQEQPQPSTSLFEPNMYSCEEDDLDIFFDV